MLTLAAATVDLGTGRVVRADGRAEKLSPKELQLLTFLAERPNVPVSRDDLHAMVWGYRPGVVSRTADTTIGTLRAKVEADANRPAHIHTVRGHGWAFRPGAAEPPRVAADPDGFVGRGRTLAAVEEAWSAGHRVVTLLGAGGIGKTRLARRLLAQEPAGLLCDCAEAENADDIAARVAAAFDCAESELDARLAESPPRLVVLDEIDRVVAAAAASVARWSAASRRLRWLVTTREPLRLESEVRFELPPLDPLESRELFVTRARRVGAAPAEDEALAQLLERLEGIPLAIELAAARTSTLTPAEILERFDGDLARYGPSTGNPRHTTLWSTIQWSWDLLDPVERSVLTQCSVFGGGFGAAAAEAVLEVPSGVDPIGVLQVLRERSLLRRATGADGASRFSLFASVRAFAGAPPRDVDPDARARAEARHRAYFAELAARSNRDPRALAPEADNLELAFRSALAADPAVAADVLWRGLGPLYLARGPTDGGIERIDGVVDRPELADAQRVRLLNLRGTMHAVRGRPGEARRNFERARGLAADLGDRDLQGVVASNLAIVSGPEEAESLLRAAIELHRHGDPAALGRALANLARLHRQRGELALARAVFAEARPLSGGLALCASAHIHYQLGDHAAAQRDLEDARALAADGPEEARTRGMAALVEAAILLDRSDVAGARAAIAEAVRFGQPLGDRFTLDGAELLGACADLLEGGAPDLERLAGRLSAPESAATATLLWAVSLLAEGRRAEADARLAAVVTGEDRLLARAAAAVQALARGLGGDRGADATLAALEAEAMAVIDRQTAQACRCVLGLGPPPPSPGPTAQLVLRVPRPV